MDGWRRIRTLPGTGTGAPSTALRQYIRAVGLWWDTDRHDTATATAEMDRKTSDSDRERVGVRSPGWERSILEYSQAESSSQKPEEEGRPCSHPLTLPSCTLANAACSGETAPFLPASARRKAARADAGAAAAAAATQSGPDLEDIYLSDWTAAGAAGHAAAQAETSQPSGLSWSAEEFARLRTQPTSAAAAAQQTPGLALQTVELPEFDPFHHLRAAHG